MFPGGMEGFYNFLSKHIRFPQEAKSEGISGKLFVSFIIDKEGNLTHIEFMRKAGYGMEESVMAVLEKSPKWTPGYVGNNQVNTKMILPVSFDLIQ
jgi:protein TonB